MFKSLKRITYKVFDLEKAKDWYSKILNIQPAYDTPIAAIFKVGDCSLSLAKVDNSLPENNEPVDVYWEVDDIDLAYNKLIENGAKSYLPVKQALTIRIAKVIDPFGNIIGITGKALNTDKRTVENQASETAMSVAFCRALASKDERGEIKGPDYIAEIFLAEEAKKLLIDNTSRKWAIQQLVTSPLYGYFIARTAFIDSVFQNACKKEIPQIVFLGAGYDTRTYRFREIIKNTKTFELDIHSTQQKKIESLKKVGISIPENLTFVPINFKTENLADVLSKTGYDKNKQSLFIWEGVIYYLPGEAVDNTLDFIKNNCTEESCICFDYMTEKLESINAAEPFRFWITKNKIETLLAKKGFKIIEHIIPDDMEKKYLTLKDGTLAEKTISKFNFILAELSYKMDQT